MLQALWKIFKTVPVEFQETTFFSCSKYWQVPEYVRELHTVVLVDIISTWHNKYCNDLKIILCKSKVLF